MGVYQGILWAHLKEAQLTADKVQERPGLDCIGASPEICFVAAPARCRPALAAHHAVVVWGKGAVRLPGFLAAEICRFGGSLGRLRQRQV